MYQSLTIIKHGIGSHQIHRSSYIERHLQQVAQGIHGLREQLFGGQCRNERHDILVPGDVAREVIHLETDPGHRIRRRDRPCAADIRVIQPDHSGAIRGHGVAAVLYEADEETLGEIILATAELDERFI